MGEASIYIPHKQLNTGQNYSTFLAYRLPLEVGIHIKINRHLSTSESGAVITYELNTI